MLPHEFQRIIPQTPQETVEILESHQLAYDFYRELKHRQAFIEHCQWYHETARQHQRELEQMNRPFNPLRWLFGS